MRRVARTRTPAALVAAAAEAGRAFGDGRVYLERDPAGPASRSSCSETALTVVA
jgi:hypothetical protein